METEGPYSAIRELVLSDAEATRCGLPADERIVSDPLRVKQFLGTLWSDTFCSANVLPPQARKFLRQYTRKVSWLWELATPPGPEDIRSFLRATKQSALGWDGVPFAAWEFGGPQTIALLDDLLSSQLEGSTPPWL